MELSASTHPFVSGVTNVQVTFRRKQLSGKCVLTIAPTTTVALTFSRALYVIGVMFTCIHSEMSTVCLLPCPLRACACMTILIEQYYL